MIKTNNLPSNWEHHYSSDYSRGGGTDEGAAVVVGCIEGWLDGDEEEGGRELNPRTSSEYHDL